MALKTCWKCKDPKPTTEFHKDRSKKDGLQASCKTCANARNAQYRKEHRDYFIQKGKEKYASIQDKKAHNKERYAKHQDRFLDRRHKYNSREEGRVVALANSARIRAEKLGLEFDISREWVAERYREQDGKCLLTGIPFDLTSKPNGDRRYRPYSPSLDRIDSSKGYTKDNTRLVCTALNIAMNAWGESVFREVCLSYLEKEKQNGTPC